MYVYDVHWSTEEDLEYPYRCNTLRMIFDNEFGKIDMTEQKHKVMDEFKRSVKHNGKIYVYGVYLAKQVKGCILYHGIESNNLDLEFTRFGYHSTNEPDCCEDLICRADIKIQDKHDVVYGDRNE